MTKSEIFPLQPSEQLLSQLAISEAHSLRCFIEKHGGAQTSDSQNQADGAV